MISISEAISIVSSNSAALHTSSIKTVEKAGGYTLFKDISAPINMPPFRQSAMDGYALNLHDSLSYTLIGEVKAGDAQQFELKPGEAVRIFTGAPVPDTANTIVMQEKVIKQDATITITAPIALDQNIRPMGEQVRKGAVALQKDTKLTPAAIGYLLSLGVTKVSVYKKPNIALVTTGNELVPPGQDLPFGKIYESNSKMLLSALYNLKFYDVTLYKVKDDYTKTVSTLKEALNANDLVLITGGISVGDYDFVGKALKELQVKELFYKVKQKPGKPLFYGKTATTQVFALPGNPAAALSCFYVYVYIALQQFMDRAIIELPRVKAKSLSHFEKRGDRPQFLKGIFKDGMVEILDGQNSSMLQTFALSNVLIVMPAESSKIEVNDTVEVIVLPV